MYKGVGFALLILSHISLRQNYFIFIGYLKNGGSEGFERPPEPPLDPQQKCSYLVAPPRTFVWGIFGSVLQQVVTKLHIYFKPTFLVCRHLCENG